MVMCIAFWRLLSRGEQALLEVLNVLDYSVFVDGDRNEHMCVLLITIQRYARSVLGSL